MSVDIPNRFTITDHQAAFRAWDLSKRSQAGCDNSRDRGAACGGGGPQIHSAALLVFNIIHILFYLPIWYIIQKNILIFTIRMKKFAGFAWIRRRRFGF
jgi:hypothetical protein